MMSRVAAEERIFLFGAGGHGRAVAEVIRRSGRYTIACVLDDDPEAVGPGGSRVAGGRDHFPELARAGLRSGFVAIGSNADRERVATLARAAGLSLATIIDPAAVIASDARIGAGTVLMPMSFAGAGVKIGDGAIVNTSATIDHDCVVGDYAHVAGGVHLTGGCRVGAASFIGTGAVVGRPVTLGERVTIGAGAVVMSDVGDGVVAVGVPARPMTPGTASISA
jgi:sugar O-acyltransferase (sialic acid O-acetyltransferase NeuD family)